MVDRLVVGESTENDQSAGDPLSGIRKRFGANLSRLRGRESREKFAERLDLGSVSALRRWEIGEVAAPADVVVRIADRLDVSVDSLFLPIEDGDRSVEEAATDSGPPTAAVETATLLALRSMVSGISATELVDRLSSIVEDDSVDVHDRGRACLDVIRAWRLDLEAKAAAEDETATEPTSPSAE